MDFKVMLLLLMNFSLPSFSASKQERNLTASDTEIGYTSLDKNCSFVENILRENNVAKCASEFQETRFNVSITEERVFQYACFLVQKILLFICKNSKPLTSRDLVLDKTHICPFNFLGISSLLNMNDNMLRQKLEINELCQRVCFDFNEPKHQCVVLRAVIQYLDDLISSSVQEKTKVPTEPPVSSNQKATVNTVNGKNPGDYQSLMSHKIDNTTKQIKLSTEPGKTDFPISKAIPEGISSVSDKNTKETVEILNVTPEGKKSTDYSNQNSIKGDEKMTSPENELMKSKQEESANYDDLGESMDQDTEGIRLDTNQLQDKLTISNDKEENKEIVQKEIFMQDPGTRNEIYSEGFFQAEESHFFFYFLMLSSVIVIGYLAFHNKNKILAYVLEGSSSRRTRRRPNPARYRKLESNLEEAISSNSTQTAASSVVY